MPLAAHEIDDKVFALQLSTKEDVIKVNTEPVGLQRMTASCAGEYAGFHCCIAPVYFAYISFLVKGAFVDTLT